MVFEDLRPEWACLECGYVWKQRTVPDKCPECGSRNITPWPVWGVTLPKRPKRGRG